MTTHNPDPAPPGPGEPPQRDTRVPGRRRLCAHADRDGAAMHWLQPGQRCPGDDHGTAETAP